jgi:solute carrier family 7 (cationic amino acid transporter), member 1
VLLILSVSRVQVSVGTLLAFTMVAVSILILRYAPPDEGPDPEYLQDPTEIKEHERRRKATYNIFLICSGALILTSSASAEFLPV